MPGGETQRLAVAACIRRRRCLCHDCACRRSDDRERVLIAMSVDTNHVVHLLCKHSTDTDTSTPPRHTASTTGDGHTAQSETNPRSAAFTTSVGRTAS